MPFGQLPVLKHDTLTIGQSGAIARYCAQYAGLMPSEIHERAFTDSIMEQCNDIFTEFGKAKLTKDAEDRTLKWKTIEDEYMPTKLQYVANLLKNKGRAFFGGGYPNAADVAVFSIMYLAKIAGLNVKSNTTLETVYNGVHDMGTVKEYIEQQHKPYFVRT